MKIGLLTIHYANSYGGNLQAFATQVVLSKYGEAKIIDYKTRDLENSMQLIRWSGGGRAILRAGKDVFRMFPRRRLLKKFKDFSSTYFNLTKPVRDKKTLEAVACDFDVLVCGSDQIWNPNVLGAFDLAYMLNFGSSQRKVSFASSAGSYSFSDSELPMVKSCLRSFHALACRELDTARKISQALDGRNVEHVLDPTLMLSKDEWMSALRIDAKETSEPYILVYTLKKDELVRGVIEYSRRKLGCRVIVIDQDSFLGFAADEHLMDASPLDYISLFSGASFVITNSFHGTAFAVNFKVPFLITRPETGANRIEGFLTAVGLKNRYVASVDEAEQVVESPIDFDTCHMKLGALRLASYDYLNRAMSV